MKKVHECRIHIGTHMLKEYNTPWKLELTTYKENGRQNRSMKMFYIFLCGLLRSEGQKIKIFFLIKTFWMGQFSLYLRC